MKARILIAISFIGTVALFSCRKSGVNPSNLALLQHKWSVVSENGGYPYASSHAGDNDFDPYFGWYAATTSNYWYFSTNDTLYRHVGNHYDTSAYALSTDGSILTISNISNSSLSMSVNVLSSSQLILAKNYLDVGPVPLLDSLKR